ncbi:uncharacterized protein LOC117318199 [Pecten maximus]|uniref:uncharacterized protein LOC117318199 n=1 Tax=Pecten maximus TaxID=6579 RepID=UPI0014581434|nr:uncharacterized protein LOC117318199 [Pecten maximus]
MNRLKVLTGLCLCTIVLIICWTRSDTHNSLSLYHHYISDDRVIKTHGQQVMTLHPRDNFQRDQRQGNTNELPLPISYSVQKTSKNHQWSTGELPNSNNLKVGIVYTKPSANGSWELDQSICNDVPVFKSVKLKTKAGPVDIYIHDPRKDAWVSAALSREGTWEQNTMELISTLLQEERDAALLDIGANIGVYTLAAATLGFKVIAVEPLKINVQRICSSLRAGNFTRNVTIVRSALSNNLQKVTLGIVINNVGGAYVLQDKHANKAKSELVTGKYPDMVWTAKLDEIIKLPGFNFKKVIIKMDVEGYENKVLSGGLHFFDVIEIPIVLMEWNYHKHALSGKKILAFFGERSYKPYSPVKNMQLNINHSNEWPADILWKKE